MIRENPATPVPETPYEKKFRTRWKLHTRFTGICTRNGDDRSETHGRKECGPQGVRGATTRPQEVRGATNCSPGTADLARKLSSIGRGRRRTLGNATHFLAVACVCARVY